jgi:hypothetical protein
VESAVCSSAFQPADRPRAARVGFRGEHLDPHRDGRARRHCRSVYDLTADEGWVSVGITRDTATFAVNSIVSWWQQLGKQRYPYATLTITADSGGSNNPRTSCGVSSCSAWPTKTACRSSSATSARHQQVEQHRSSDVQLREPQLARQAA